MGFLPKSSFWSKVLVEVDTHLVSNLKKKMSGRRKQKVFVCFGKSGTLCYAFTFLIDEN